MGSIKPCKGSVVAQAFAVRTEFCGARYRFSAVGRGGGRRGERGHEWGTQLGASPPVNINTDSAPRRTGSRGEITTLNIYGNLVSRIKIRLF